MVNNHEMSAQFGEWVIAKDHPPSIAYVVLSAFAAIASYLIARLFHLPEAYWAPMSTLIVMKLTLSAALPSRRERSDRLRRILANRYDGRRGGDIEAWAYLDLSVSVEAFCKLPLRTSQPVSSAHAIRLS